jgi:HTH-type transcriptional regulator / antitoxin MqsA
MTYPCYACGSDAAIVCEPREVWIGQRNATVPGKFVRCPSCAEEYFLPGQMEALQKAASEAIRRAENLLTSLEIRTFRERLGLSQAEFESLLGVGPKTAVRWEKGTVFQSAAVDTLIRLLMRHLGALEDLARQRGIRLPNATYAEEALALELTEDIRHEDFSRAGRSITFSSSGALPRVDAANDLFAMSA